MTRRSSASTSGRRSRRWSYEVCAEAREGTEAVELAADAQPDLAIIDIKMPGLDGIEAARRSLARRSVPVVMRTAHGSDDLISRAVEAGVVACLVKPHRSSDLQPTIEAARARRAEHVAARSPAAEEDMTTGDYPSGYGYVA